MCQTVLGPNCLQRLSVDGTSKEKVNVFFQLESLYLGDRQSLDAARGELAAVQVKCEKLLVKVCTKYYGCNVIQK